MFKPLYKAIKLITISSTVLIITACAQTGYSYSTSQFSSIKAGESTLDDVNEILGAHPTNVYRALDGSFTAMYSHKATLLTDAIYFNRELLLAFDNEGKFKNIVGGAGQTPRSSTENVGDSQDKNFSGGLSNKESASTKGNTTTIKNDNTNSQSEVIAVDVNGQANTKTSLTETTIKETVTTIKETEYMNNNDAVNTNSVSSTAAVASGNTKSLSDNAAGASTGAPNTYPVYIKRSGSNVLKRYDVQ